MHHAIYAIRSRQTASNWLHPIAVSVVVTAVIAAFAPVVSSAEDQPLAVNFVAVNERLHTAGQPNAAALSSLAGRGYAMVINLAPPTAQGAVATEHKLLEDTGVSYLNIPVDWQNPRAEDFELFSAALENSEERQVLVHCQMNMRASMFTFLYRVIHEDVPIDAAYETLKKVWTPQGHWATFGTSVLKAHGIAFEFPPGG